MISEAMVLKVLKFRISVWPLLFANHSIGPSLRLRLCVCVCMFIVWISWSPKIGIKFVSVYSCANTCSIVTALCCHFHR